MLGNYFYHEIIRKTVIAFGTLFNDIHVRHDDGAGNVISEIKVPIAYGPRQKFLARVTQQAELNKATQITLQRMSFEITNISYDPTRKASITQTFKAQDVNNSKMKKVFMPVPYNLGFDLNILVKLQDDGLQILEQILPFFQPAFNISIDLVKSIGEKRDIPMVLQNISQQDDYEGDSSTRRALIYTLSLQQKHLCSIILLIHLKVLLKKFSWITTQILIQEQHQEFRDIQFYLKLRKIITKIML